MYKKKILTIYICETACIWYKHEIYFSVHVYQMFLHMTFTTYILHIYHMDKYIFSCGGSFDSILKWCGI